MDVQGAGNVGHANILAAAIDRVSKFGHLAAKLVMSSAEIVVLCMTVLLLLGRLDRPGVQFDRHFEFKA